MDLYGLLSCDGSFPGDEQRLPPLNVPVERGRWVLQPVLLCRLCPWDRLFDVLLPVMLLPSVKQR